MINSFPRNLLAATIATLLLSGCGDAETTIIEKAPIVEPTDSDDNGSQNDNDIIIESNGRLAILSADNQANVIDLDDKTLLDTYTLTHDSYRLSASAGFRFAVLTSRSNDNIEFVDGGLWREDHGEHLHDYKQAPVMSDYSLTGSQPTHVVSHHGQMAVFYDGNSETGAAASVQVVTDIDITNETSELPVLDYAVNMHGVAEPRGEHMLSTIRREDADSTSGIKILPDQIGVYHLHDNMYEQEQILDVTCPDLHGAAQNEEAVVFGCGDGVLVAHQHGEEYEAAKIANIDELNGLRIGAIYGHEESHSFIGTASDRATGKTMLLNIVPDHNEMEMLEWQPEAAPISYAFSHEGDKFLVLDSQGVLNVLEAHAHDGETHWELETQLTLSEADLSTMPEGMSFSMTVAQNGEYVYVADPIAQHVLQIDLGSMEVVGDIELAFSPASITWLGIAEEEHDHDHD